MKDNVRKELDSLEAMLRNWEAGFMSWATQDGDNEHVFMEFTEEIQSHIFPYVKRLYEANHLTETEAKEFMNYCFSQVERLREKLRKANFDESEKEV